MKMRLAFKISLPIILTMIILISVILITDNQIIRTYKEQEKETLISKNVYGINESIKRIENNALLISSVLSDMEIVKEAYSHYYETGDLKNSALIIQNELINVDNAIYNNLSTSTLIHFHLPPAISFIRSWTIQKGDDIASFRKTILSISENQKAITGIDVDQSGIVMTGISPIFGNRMEYYGSVETIYPITELLRDTKFSDDEQFAILMLKDLLHTATKFQYDTTNNVKPERMEFGNMVLVGCSSNEFQLDNLNSDILLSGMKTLTKFEKEDYQYAVFPITNFSNETVGVGIIQLNMNRLNSQIRRAGKINILVGLSSAVLIALLVLLFIRLFVTKPISAAIETINKIADNDIRMTIISSRKDEIGVLYKAINKIVEDLRTIIRNISDTSATILATCERLYSSASSMSDSAIQQSASTEEISSSMEEMLATVESNTLKAEKTGDTTKRTAQEININNIIINEAIQSVYKIISEVFIISEIATKTDILSINAAIEAAHAGDKGKGFAILAQEIRKLADKSRDSASKIEKLSGESHILSREAGEKLHAINSDIVNSSQLVDDIVNTSKELMTNIGLINTSILQLAEITNINTAISEQISASAEELHAQAELLKERITIFKI